MSCKSIVEEFESSDRWKDFINSFDHVLTDCDGVLWLDDNMLPGSAETLALFRKLGKKIGFVTNNSTKCVEEYMKKFEKLGLEAYEKELFCTSYCVVAYLKSLGFDKKVYLIATSGTSQELTKAGIKHLPIGPDPIESSWQDTLNKGIELDKDVGAVVVAYDDHISYLKLAKAVSYLNDPKCLYIASNTDEQFPSKSNSSIVVPGTGTIVSAVTTGCQRNPVILGKPSPFMFECIKFNFPEINAERCLMIGDRMNTDIAFGRCIGAKTLLTMTGVTSENELKELQKSDDVVKKASLLPDYVAPKLGDLNKFLKKELDSSA